MSSRLGSAGTRIIGRTLAVATALCLTAAVQAQVSPQLLQGMQWRNVGPFIAGKVDSVAGVSGKPSIGYVGTDNGGGWEKGESGGTCRAGTDAGGASRGVTAQAGGRTG